MDAVQQHHPRAPQRASVTPFLPFLVALIHGRHKHSKYGTQVGAAGCNGKKCLFQVRPIAIEEGCALWKEMEVTAILQNRTEYHKNQPGHFHIFSSVDINSYSICQCSKSKFNCLSDNNFPDWRPEVKLTANAKAGDKYSVDICNTKFPNSIYVFKLDIASIDRVRPSTTLTEQVKITTTPSPLPSGCSVALACQTDTGTTGIATVSPATVNQTTTVTITGVDQSWGASSAAPDNIELQAKWGSCIIARERFTVCAHPCKITSESKIPEVLLS